MRKLSFQPSLTRTVKFINLFIPLSVHYSVHCGFRSYLQKIQPAPLLEIGEILAWPFLKIGEILAWPLLKIGKILAWPFLKIGKILALAVLKNW